MTPEVHPALALVLSCGLSFLVVAGELSALPRSWCQAHGAVTEAGSVSWISSRERTAPLPSDPRPWRLPIPAPLLGFPKQPPSAPASAGSGAFWTLALAP